MRVDDLCDPDHLFPRSRHLRLKMLGYFVEAQLSKSPLAKVGFVLMATTYKALADRVERKEAAKGRSQS